MGHYTSWTNSMQREIQYIRRHRTDAKPDYLIIPADNKKPTYLCTPSIQKSRIIKYVYINRYTVGGGSAPFYIVNYYIKWVNTSWSDVSHISCPKPRNLWCYVTTFFWSKNLGYSVLDIWLNCKRKKIGTIRNFSSTTLYFY